MKIKGHTTIELTNIETGEKKVYDDDNVVTSFFEKMFQQNGMLCFNPFSMFVNGRQGDYKFLNNSFIKELTGGLFLFQEEVDEDTSNIWPRSGNIMIGQGSDIAYNGGLMTVGTYNTSESGISEDGNSFKHVWDFSTSQGNGKISCACLTSIQGGKIGAGTKQQVVPSDFSSELNYYSYSKMRYSSYFSGVRADRYGVVCDYNNNCMYQMFGDFSCNDEAVAGNEKQYNLLFSKEVLVRKVKIPLNEINIFDKIGSEDRETIEEFKIHLPQELFSKIPDYDSIFNGDESSTTERMFVPSCWNAYGLHVYLYIHFAGITTSNKMSIRYVNENEDFYIIDFDLVNKTSHLITVNNATGQKISPWVEDYWMSVRYTDNASSEFERRCWYNNSSVIHPIFVTNKYVLIVADNGKMYRISLSDNTNVKEFTEANGDEYYFDVGKDAHKVRKGSFFLPLGKSVSDFDNNKLLAFFTGNESTFALDIENAIITRLTTGRISDVIDRFGVQIIGSDLCIDQNSSYMGCGMLPIYLATINNLSSPVEKTSAETMKVIYTLTKA